MTATATMSRAFTTARAKDRETVWGKLRGWLRERGFVLKSHRGDTFMEWEIETGAGILGVNFSPRIDAGPRFEFVSGDILPETLLNDPSFRFSDRPICKEGLGGYVTIPSKLATSETLAYLKDRLSCLLSVCPGEVDRSRALPIAKLRTAYRESVSDAERENEQREKRALAAMRQLYPTNSPAAALWKM